MFYKTEKNHNQDKIREVLGHDFYNDLLDIKDTIKLDRTILDIFTNVFKLTKSLLSLIISLSFSSHEACSGFLHRRKCREKMLQENFPVLALKNLMDMK